ncbi:MAG: glycosyltransferase [Halothece sp. Uz-M2-17]|nr:glycosyltransferase [Halothece sp. Uz-M2-17]
MLKIALVHDYLTQRGGAERVFELFCQYFPEADIFTSIYEPRNTISIPQRRINTTVLQNIPFSKRYFRLLAPLYFAAFRKLDLQEYDLIISSTSSFAKAVKKREDAIHICFCHNVTRFLWDTQTYLKEYQTYRSFTPVLNSLFNFLREQDLEYAQEPNVYIANSTTVAQRIQAIYGREAFVVNYPVDARKFSFSEEKDSYYLVSSRLLSYKRIDIIIEAFNWLGWPLLIIGDGPERESLEKKALDNIKFLGFVSDELRTFFMSKARAVIVAALEDYGLVPIEANLSGTPVIAYGAGGILDTQIDGKTGILFKKQTPDALQAALYEAQHYHWDYQQINHHARSNFSQQVFFQKIEEILQTQFA